MSSALRVMGLVVGVTLVSYGCGSADPQLDHRRQAIVGGRVVPSGAWPGVVWLDVGCSGLLVQKDLVIYAGHCGTRVSRVFLGNRVDVVVEEDGSVTSRGTGDTESVEVLDCRAHPAGGLTSGRDIAFCLLAEDADERGVIFPLRGCERQALGTGQTAKLIGFGFDGETGAGTKREVDAPIAQIGTELEIGDAMRGTCSGDSGGPALVAVGSGSAPKSFQWRAAGVLSSGRGSDCGSGYYTDLANVLDWLEYETQRRLTPCFDGAIWQPSPLCRYFPIASDGQLLGDSPETSTTCGPPRRPVYDRSPPRLSITDVDALGSDLRVAIGAADDDSGVSEVTVTVLSLDDEVMSSRTSEWPPFTVRVPLFPNGARLRATAKDYAGLVSSVTAPLPWHGQGARTEGGCSFKPGGGLPYSTSSTLVLAWMLRALRRRTRHATTGCLPPPHYHSPP